jgi:hypothetical protein
VTDTGPEVAPAGTGTTIEVALQLAGDAAAPLKVTVPCVVPKFIPVIVTAVPTCPAVGERLLITGVFSTEKLVPLLETPDTVTTTFPVVAPLGTGTTIDTAFQLLGVADVPLNVTVLVPWLEPKLVPVMVTEVPDTPEVGDKLTIPGVCKTVNKNPGLGTPLTVTTILPLVAPFGTGTTMLPELQEVGVAFVPLNVTVLDPCVDPKLVPVIVTDVPATAEFVDRPVMFGVTVKFTPLLA